MVQHAVVPFAQGFELTVLETRQAPVLVENVSFIPGRTVEPKQQLRASIAIQTADGARNGARRGRETLQVGEAAVWGVAAEHGEVALALVRDDQFFWTAGIELRAVEGGEHPDARLEDSACRNLNLPQGTAFEVAISALAVRVIGATATVRTALTNTPAVDVAFAAVAHQVVAARFRACKLDAKRGLAVGMNQTRRAEAADDTADA